MEIRINITNKTFSIIGKCTGIEITDIISDYNLEDYSFEGTIEVTKEVVREVVRDNTWIDKVIKPLVSPTITPNVPWYTTSATSAEHTLTEEQEEELFNSQVYYK